MLLAFHLLTGGRGCGKKIRGEVILQTEIGPRGAGCALMLLWQSTGALESPKSSQILHDPLDGADAVQTSTRTAPCSHPKLPSFSHHMEVEAHIQGTCLVLHDNSRVYSESSVLCRAPELQPSCAAGLKGFCHPVPVSCFGTEFYRGILNCITKHHWMVDAS